jgi:hypothetical protein
LTDQSQSLRRYESFSDIERMVSRTAFNQLSHSSLLLLCTIAGMVITYLAPPLLVAHRQKTSVLYVRCGLGSHDDDVLDHGALLSTEPAWALALRWRLCFI